MNHILAHLRRDKKLSGVLDKVELKEPAVDEDVYLILLRSISEQQVSLKAAATIWGRFLDLFDEYPHPELVLEYSVDQIQKCGLSFRKSEYMQNIARFAIEDDLSAGHIRSLDDEEAIAHMSKIKGVGKWTAEMILMFSLNRPDIFPVDDLVVRNAMIKLYSVKSERKQLYADLEEIANVWRPYRSYACYALWNWYERD